MQAEPINLERIVPLYILPRTWVTVWTGWYKKIKGKEKLNGKVKQQEISFIVYKWEVEIVLTIPHLDRYAELDLCVFLGGS